MNDKYPTLEEKRDTLKAATVAWLRRYSPTRKYPSMISEQMMRGLVATLKQIDRAYEKLKAGER